MIDTYIIERREETSIGYKRDYSGFTLPLIGAGYLSGKFPDGITTIGGVPVSAVVRVLLRSAIDGYGDGAVVATTKSKQDGTWKISNLPEGLRYDVVARYDGENDVIVSNVAPAIL